MCAHERVCILGVDVEIHTRRYSSRMRLNGAANWWGGIAGPVRRLSPPHQASGVPPIHIFSTIMRSRLLVYNHYILSLALYTLHLSYFTTSTIKNIFPLLPACTSYLFFLLRLTSFLSLLKVRGKRKKMKKGKNLQTLPFYLNRTSILNCNSFPSQSTGRKV